MKFFQEGAIALRHMEPTEQDYAQLYAWLADARIAEHYGGLNHRPTLQEVHEKYAPYILGKEAVVPGGVYAVLSCGGAGIRLPRVGGFFLLCPTDGGGYAGGRAGAVGPGIGQSSAARIVPLSERRIGRRRRFYRSQGK